MNENKGPLNMMILFLSLNKVYLYSTKKLISKKFI